MEKHILESKLITDEQWAEYQKLKIQKERNIKMNSGIYIRVGKEDKLLEQMSDEERHEWLEKLVEKEQLVRCIDILCETLYWYEIYKEI